MTALLLLAEIGAVLLLFVGLVVVLSFCQVAAVGDRELEMARSAMVDPAHVSPDLDALAADFEAVAADFESIADHHGTHAKH